MNNQDFLEMVNESPQTISSTGIGDCLRGADAFWTYEGSPRAEAPHALLTSDKHSVDL